MESLAKELLEMTAQPASTPETKTLLIQVNIITKYIKFNKKMLAIFCNIS